MPDIAQYGVRIKAPEGVDQTVQGFRKIDDAAKRTTGAVDKHAGAFNNATAAMTKHSTSAMMLLRTLGPLAGGATEIAERLERAAVRAERLGANAASTASQQKILENAFRSGAIAAASMEAAQTRLTTARQAATAIEQAYARAVAASRVAQEESRIATANLREQKAVTGALPSTSAGTGLQEFQQWETAQKRLTAAQGEAVITSNALRGATAEERALKLQLAAANKESAAAQELMNNASKASGAGFGATAAVVAGLVAVLIGLAVAIYAADKAWHLFQESVAEAAKMEQAKVGLESLLGTAQRTTDVFNQIRELSVKSGGRFTVEGLSDAAVKMSALGVATGNLIPRLEAFAQLAARTTNGTIEGIVQIYDRAIDSITSGIGLSTRELRSFTNQGVNLADMLAKSMGTTNDAAKDLILSRKLSVEQLNAAFESMLGQEGALDKRAATWTGFIGKIKAGWGEVLARFSEPILTTLEPILAAISKRMPQIEELSAKAGEAIAGLIDDLARVASGGATWTDAIFLVWQALAAKMANFMLETLVAMFKEIGPAAAEAMWVGFATAMKAKFSSLSSFFNPFYAGITEGGMAAVDAMVKRLKLKVPDIATAGQAAGRGVASVAMGLDTTDNFATGTRVNAINLALAEHKRLLEQIRGEEQLLKDNPFISPEDKQIVGLRQMHGELDQLSKVIEEDKGLLAASLNQPDVHEKVRADLQRDEQAFASLQLKIQESEHPIAAAIGKWSQALGTFADKTGKLITDVADRFSEGFSTALGDLITGTKDAATAFREMAVSMLQDISRMIIKMLVLQAIQAALGYFGGGRANVSAGMPTANATGTGPYGMAIGGLITGRSHSGGGEMINAEGGEYIIRKDRVRNESIENLDAYNQGRAHIVRRYGDGGTVWGGSHYGGDPRTLEPPFAGDRFGNAADRSFYNSNLATRFNSDIPQRTPVGGVNATVLGNTAQFWTGVDEAATALGLETPDLVGDVPPAERPTYGLPAGPGGLANEPYIGREPTSGGYAFTPNSIGNFGGNFSLPFIPAWSGLGFGTRPGGTSGSATVSGGASISLAPNNAALPPALAALPQAVDYTPYYVPPTPDRQFGSLIDPATGMQLPIVGTDASGTPIVRDPSGAQHAFTPGGVTSTVGGGTRWDFTQGRYVANNNATGAQFNSQAANSLMMWYQSMGGNPNSPGQGDVRDKFYPTVGTAIMQIDPESGMPIPSDRTFTGGGRDSRWVFPSQSESAALGLSFSAQKYNDWLIAHNQWAYAAIPTHHAGGIVGTEGTFATGGFVGDRIIKARDGEGVFTQGQMAAIGAGMSGGGARVEVNINVDSHDNVSSTVSGGDNAGLSAEEWRKLGRTVGDIVDSKLAESKRWRGQSYRSRTGAPS